MAQDVTIFGVRFLEVPTVSTQGMCNIAYANVIWRYAGTALRCQSCYIIVNASIDYNVRNLEVSASQGATFLKENKRNGRMKVVRTDVERLL